MACGETTRIQASSFSKRLGVEVSVAQGLINRLEREGFVRAPLKGKRYEVVHSLVIMWKIGLPFDMSQT